MAQRKSHFYLFTAVVTYKQMDKTHQITHNLFAQTPERRITMADFDSARLSLIQELFTQKEIAQEEIRSLAFIAISYLGHMTSKEFAGEQEEVGQLKERAPQVVSPFDA